MSIRVYTQQLDEVSREMQTLSLRSNLTAQEDRRLTYLTSQAATYRTLIGACKEEPAAQPSPEEQRSMLRTILGGRPTREVRTYSPLLSADSPYVPQGFVKQLAEAQMSAGPLFAGSPLLTDVTNSETGPSKIPVMDDTASTGFEHTEATTESDGATYALSSVTSTLRSWSSGIVTYSMELGQDVTAFDKFTSILARSLGRRIGRIQNSSFLSSIITTLGSNSSAHALSSETSGVVTYDDCACLAGSVNAAYRANGAFLMNSKTATGLSRIKDSQGRPIMREVIAPQPKLLGYPVYISDYMADFSTTGNIPLIFGDWSTLFYRATDFSITVFKERFIEQGSYALVARRRADIQYTIPSASDSAIKMLTVS